MNATKELELPPPPRYPKLVSLESVIEDEMGSGLDPDAYLKGEATPTDKERKNRSATVKAIINGTIN